MFSTSGLMLILSSCLWNALFAFVVQSVETRFGSVSLLPFRDNAYKRIALSNLKWATLMVIERKKIIVLFTQAILCTLSEWISVLVS